MPPKWQYVQYQMREYSQNDNLCKNAQKTECFQNDFKYNNEHKRMFPKWRFIRENAFEMTICTQKTKDRMLLKWQFVRECLQNDNL